MKQQPEVSPPSKKPQTNDEMTGREESSRTALTLSSTDAEREKGRIRHSLRWRSRATTHVPARRDKRARMHGFREAFFVSEHTPRRHLFVGSISLFPLPSPIPSSPPICRLRPLRLPDSYYYFLHISTLNFRLPLDSASRTTSNETGSFLFFFHGHRPCRHSRTFDRPKTQLDLIFLVRCAM